MSIKAPPSNTALENKLRRVYYDSIDIIKKEKFRQKYSNLNESEKTTLKLLKTKAKTDLVILPNDKGGELTVMNKTE